MGNNQSYFEEINNPMKAYLLGFILADGYIFDNKWGAGFRIEVAKKDEGILLMMNGFFGGNTNVIYRQSRGSCYLTIKGKEFYANLKEYFDKRDSGELFRYCNELNRYMVLGLSDGDGCVFVSNKAIGWSFISKSEKFMVNFYNYLRIASDVDFMPPYKTKQNIWGLKVHGNIKARKFLSWLYQDTRIMGLLRKRKIWEDHNGESSLEAI